MWWRTYAWLVPVVIVLYATYMAWPATREYFNPDDIANMYRGKVHEYFKLVMSQLGVWTNYDRLLGILYFKGMYDVFGFHLLPFRIGTLVVCAVNLALFYAFLRHLFPDQAVRWVALLAASFHGAMWSIYASAGTIFDVLCQTFTLVAVLYYAASRHKPARNWRLVAIGLATNCAIASKELGYAVPLILTAYELLIVPHQLAGYDWRDRLSAIPRLAVSYGVALVAGVGSLLFYDVMRMPEYAPTYSWGRFLESTQVYAEMLLFRTLSLPASTWLLAIVALLVVALAIRSRNAVFGWMFYNLSVLPMVFSTPRHDGYVLYIAYLGCAIYWAALLEAVWARTRRPEWRIATAVLAASLLLWMQNEQSEDVPGRFGPGGQNTVQPLAEQIIAKYPSFPPNTRILLINDSTGVDGFQPIMTLRLVYHDESLTIDKLALADDAPVPAHDPPYDHTFLYKNNRYEEIRVR